MPNRNNRSMECDHFLLRWRMALSADFRREQYDLRDLKCQRAHPFAGFGDIFRLRASFVSPFIFRKKALRASPHITEE